MYINLFVLVTCFSHLVFLLPVFKGVELDLCITMLHLGFKGVLLCMQIIYVSYFSTFV